MEDEYLEIFLVQLPLVELLAAATLPLPVEGKCRAVEAMTRPVNTKLFITLHLSKGTLPIFKHC